MTQLKGSLPIGRTVLDNGLVLLVNERPQSELVNIRVSFLAGSVFEADTEAGLSRFTANMMMRGTKSRSYRQIISQVESQGAGIRFTSGRDGAQVTARCTPRSFERTVRILLDCLRNPTFPENEMENVRGEMLTHILLREDSTAEVAHRVAMEMLFPKGNPFHSDPGGYQETVGSITRDQLERFWYEHYGPESAVLSLSGGISLDQVQRRVGRALSDWEPHGFHPQTPPVEVERPVKRDERVIPMMHKSQVDLVVMVQAIPRRHPDYYPLRAADIILGKLGLMGRLGKNIRDRQGLAYYASSSLSPHMTGGFWAALAGVNPQNVERTLQSIGEEMRRISLEPVTKRELADTKTNQIGSLVLRLETCEAASSIMQDIERFGLGLDYVERYEDIIRSVGLEDIQRVCSLYLDPDEAVTVTAGPYEG